MQTSFGPMDGPQWERHSHQLLALRHREDDYQKVPAKFGGDLGIEGFTKNGVAYQCYCPSDNPTDKELYEHQRDKITEDIGKLIKNEKQLSSLLGTTKITKWVFLTPDYKNKALLAHCAKKEEEVRRKSCAHISTSFSIVIKTETDFIPEGQTLVSAGKGQVSISIPVIASPDIISWKNSQGDMYVKLLGKISKIPQVKNPDSYAELNIQRYLEGQQRLDQLRKTFPIHWEKVIEIKRQQERKVKRYTVAPSMEAGLFIENCMKEFEVMVEKTLGNSIDPALSASLAEESISGLLVECPLDF
jgi:hypothetical protein